MAKFFKNLWQSFTIACCMNNKDLVRKYGYDGILHMFEEEA